jgi:hypothetical protein
MAYGKNKGTQHTYRSATLAHMGYRKLNPKQLIDEADADEQKSKRERRS